MIRSIYMTAVQIPSADEDHMMWSQALEQTTKLTKTVFAKCSII